MDATMNGRIILQSDWNTVLREKDSKAWIMYSKKGQDSVHASLISSGAEPQEFNAQQRLSVKCDCDNFVIHKINLSICDVTFAPTGQRTVFCAPFKEMGGVYEKRNPLIDLATVKDGLALCCADDTHPQVFDLLTNQRRFSKRSLKGHLGDVYCARLFPSGVVGITGGADMRLKIWSVPEGKSAATLQGHTGAVTDISIVDVGRNVLSASRDGTVRLWDVGQQTTLHEYEIHKDERVNCISQSATGITVSSSKTSEREVATAGKLLVAGNDAGEFKGFSLQGKDQVFAVQQGAAVNCCSIVTDVMVALGTADSRLVLYDLRNLSHPLHSAKERRSAILSFLNSDYGFFVTTGDGSCFRVDADTFASTLEFTGPDCVPVTRCVTDSYEFYTACRDGWIRQYSVPGSNSAQNHESIILME